MMELQENPIEIKETEIWVMEMKGKKFKTLGRSEEGKQRKGIKRKMVYWVV